MNETEFQELSAGYALNALSVADHRAVEGALRAHPAWAEYVRADVDTSTILADTAEAVPPPSHIRANLLEAIASTPQGRSATHDAPETTNAGADDASSLARPARRRARRGWFALAASLALVAALSIGGATIWQLNQPPAAVVALEQIQQAPDAESARFTADGLDATAYWSAETGTAVLVSDGLPQLTDDETFELWFVRDGAPVSAGTFSAASGDATALLDGQLEQGDIIAVTVEPAGGSPTGAPSTNPIVAIET